MYVFPLTPREDQADKSRLSPFKELYCIYNQRLSLFELFLSVTVASKQSLIPMTVVSDIVSESTQSV